MELRVNTDNGNNPTAVEEHEVPQQPNNPYRNKQGEATTNGRPNDGTPGKPRRETVIVRVEQPVEGVESGALTLLRGCDGDVLSPSARNIVFTWKRSTEPHACIATGCSNPDKIASIQLLATGQRYCSSSCALTHTRNSPAPAAGTGWNQRFYSRLRDERAKNHPGTSREELDRDDGGTFIWPMPARHSGGSGGGLEALASRNDRPAEWETVGSGRNYIPTIADRGHLMKVECVTMSKGEETSRGESKASHPVIPAPPPPIARELVQNESLSGTGTSTAFTSNTPAGAVDFRVVSYNVLAEIYATRQMYPYCPLWAIKWSYRKVKLLKEMQMLDGDIVCLQEVQNNHFKTFWLPSMKALGYAGHYKAKTRDADGSSKVDGCALFYKPLRFTLRDQHTIEFNQLVVSAARNGHFSGGSPPANQQSRVTRATKRLTRDNIAQLCMFDVLTNASTGATTPLLLCNTHIFWDPEYPEVKLWQTNQLLSQIQNVLRTEGIQAKQQQQRGTPAKDIPVVLCGDFNSMPGSSVLQLLTQGHVAHDHPDLADPARVLPYSSTIRHSLNLASAYSMCMGEEPAYTNYTSTYQGVLDYIFVSEGLLTPLSVHEVLAPEVVGAPLPNPQQPSDHVSIAVDLRLGGSPMQGGAGVTDGWSS